MKNLTVNEQLGYSIGSQITSQLPILSTDMLQSTKNIIKVDKKLAQVWRKKENDYQENRSNKLFYENLKWYHRFIEDVYLEDKITVFVRQTVKPDNLLEFGLGFEAALWDCDFSHYKYSKIIKHKFGNTYFELTRDQGTIPEEYQ